MKICPTCRRTYEDDGLNFCLEDGVMLNYASADAAPTVVMSEPRPTNPMPSGSQGPDAAKLQNAIPYSVQPNKRSSRTWLWVLGIFAVLILVCGGGLAGLFVYIASKADADGNFVRGPNNSSSAKNANTLTRVTPGPTASPSDVREIDLSEWVDEPTEWLETEFADGEFHMKSKQKGYYYALVAKRDEYAGAPIARVTLRNPGDLPAELGYGLIFHSDVTPLTNDYAFLIDTKRKKYRVVRHEAEQEKTITAWTDSKLIKPGPESNTLEARDKGENIELYINGQLATTITNKQGPKGGVPGLYVGDGAKIGFKKLEVLK